MQWKYLIYALVILLVITVVQKGVDKVKEDPLAEGVDTTIETTKSIIEYITDIIGTGEKQDDVIVYGMIPCRENSDCNAFSECSDDCTCDTGSGECFK